MTEVATDIWSLDERTMRRLSTFVELRRRSLQTGLKPLAEQSGAGRNFRTIHHYLTGYQEWNPQIAEKVLTYFTEGNRLAAEILMSLIKNASEGCYLDQETSLESVAWWPSVRAADDLFARVQRAERNSDSSLTFAVDMPTWLLARKAAHARHQTECRDWTRRNSVIEGLNRFESLRYDLLPRTPPGYVRTVLILDGALRYRADNPEKGLPDGYLADCLERIVLCIKRKWLRFGTWGWLPSNARSNLEVCEEITCIGDRFEFIRSRWLLHLYWPWHAMMQAKCFQDTIMLEECRYLPHPNESKWAYRESPAIPLSPDCRNHREVIESIVPHLCCPLEPAASIEYLGAFIRYLNSRRDGRSASLPEALVSKR